MFFCYVDESGTPDIPGNTSHYVLAGLSLPVWEWKECDRQVETVKAKYGIAGSEIHVAWLLRPYLEQKKINRFDSLDHAMRRTEVESYRKREILRLQRAKNPKLLRQTRKNFKKTAAYIHLNYDERFLIVKELAECVAGWKFARLFAECVDKIHFDPARASLTVDEQSFMQIVSRFEQYLQFVDRTEGSSRYLGLLIHDNNDTVAKKHTNLMKKFHREGTHWTKIDHIIETPLFVDSQLTSMVQIADLCGYALRRYLENGEEVLFDMIFQRADKIKDGTVVGVRHFTNKSCTCKICVSHRK